VSDTVAPVLRSRLVSQYAPQLPECLVLVRSTGSMARLSHESGMAGDAKALILRRRVIGLDQVLPIVH